MIYSDTVGGGRLLLAAVQCAAELCDVGGGDIGRGDAILQIQYRTFDNMDLSHDTRNIVGPERNISGRYFANDVGLFFNLKCCFVLV